MWTNSELREVRDRAELEASVAGISNIWLCACFDLAAAAERLEGLTSRIERGELTACAKPLQAIEGRRM